VIVVEIAVVKVPSLKVSVYAPTSSLIVESRESGKTRGRGECRGVVRDRSTAEVTVAVTVELLPMMTLPPASSILTTG